jgi:hypothetical protein
MLPCREEQSNALEHAIGPQMATVRDLESRRLQSANELVNREARDAIGVKHLRS